MNLHLRKKIYLLAASIIWCLSPYMALATDSNDQVQAALAAEVPAVVIPQYEVISVSTHQVTAYTSEVAQCDASPCITANGFNLCANNQEDVIAANFLKFGTKVRIPELFGDRVFTVQDRMNRRFPSHVDVWMKDYDQAIEFGTQAAKIEILAEPTQTL
jgi:3D (Asp-Asp-Asp) domain-containing protein